MEKSKKTLHQILDPRDNPYPMPKVSINHVRQFIDMAQDETEYCIEECSELIKALSKMRRQRRKVIVDGENVPGYDEAYASMVEEIADVYLTLNNLREQYGISVYEIQLWINKKLNRYGFTPEGPEVMPQLED